MMTHEAIRKMLRDGMQKNVKHLDSEDRDVKWIAKSMMQTCQLAMVELAQASGETAKITAAACAFFSVNMKDVQAEGRGTKTVSRARLVAMYLTRKLTGLSLTEIGLAFGRDHTTVLSACQSIDSLRLDDRDFAQQLEIIERSITASEVKPELQPA